MITVKLPDAIGQEITEQADRLGETQDDFIRQAILLRLQDLEDQQDINLAKARMKDIGPRTSLHDMVKEFDLED